MPKYSFYILPYFLVAKEPLADSMVRLAEAGYDAVELPGEPDQFDVSDVRRLARKHNLQISSVSGRWTAGRFLVHADPKVRANTITYLKGLVDFAARLSAPIVIVQPTETRSPKPATLSSLEWEWAAEGIREVGLYAQSLGLKLAIEAANRYDTYMLNKLEHALALRDTIGLDNVGIMADMFHLNIEEVSMTEAIRSAGRHLFHFHFCDNDRSAPGCAHIDFLPVLRALKDIDYQGYFTMELLTPRWPHDTELGPQFMKAEGYPKIGIQHLRRLWAQL
jgi:sugar phosphate isomerase/epimerase